MAGQRIPLPGPGTYALSAKATSNGYNSVVIVRLRGRSDLGSTLTDTLGRYAESLRDTDSKLVLVTDHDRVLDQLAVTGVTRIVGDDNIYRSDEWIGRTLRRAHGNAREWVSGRRSGGTTIDESLP